MGFAESERDQVGDRVDSNVDYSFQERLALKKILVIFHAKRKKLWKIIRKSILSCKHVFFPSQFVWFADNTNE